MLPRADDEKKLFPDAWGNLLEHVRAMPGVEKASLTSAALFDGAPPLIGLRTNGRHSTPADPTSVILFVSPDYFRTLSINVVEGRGFEERDSQRNSPPIAIVNQTFARKFFGQENPIGRKLTKMADSPNWIEIAGVVKDAKFGSLRNPAPPILYVPYVQMANWMPPQAHPGFAMTVQVKGRQGLASFGTELRREAGARFTIAGISEQQQLIDDSIIRERLLSNVGRIFSLLSLALATLGLYGVMAYAVVQRRQEIGVRMAVGAPPARILRLVLQESAGIILTGLAAGLVIAAAGTRMTKALLFGLTPFDPSTFLTASCVLLAATFVAALVPAYRASIVDPMITLRHD
jgi:predicted permease